MRQQVPAPLSANPAHMDIIFRLAWWVYVRATALDAHYLLVKPMNLNLMIHKKQSLEKVLNELRQLKHTRTLSDDKLTSQLGVDTYLKIFHQHTKLAEHVATLN